MSAWRRVLPARLRRRAVAGEVDDELAFHLEMRAQELIGRGMSAERAGAETFEALLRTFADRGLAQAIRQRIFGSGSGSLGHGGENDSQRANSGGASPAERFPLPIALLIRNANEGRRLLRPSGPDRKKVCRFDFALAPPDGASIHLQPIFLRLGV